MALRPDRDYGGNFSTDISKFMNETGEKGEVLVHSTGGSGASMDDPNAVVTTPAAAGGSGLRLAGILLTDVVNLDLTRQHINWHKDEVQVGGKVTLLKHGVIVTNVIDTGQTPTIGAAAYFNSGSLTVGGVSQGWLSTSFVVDGATLEQQEARADQYRVGTFESVKDADGFAKISVNIP